MKYVYKFTTWLLFEIITGIVAFNCGILYLGKKQKENAESNSTPVITKTVEPKSDRYKRTKVGFQYDETES